MSDKEVAVVARTIDPLMSESEKWCLAWPILQPGVLLITCINTIVQAPHLPLDALLLMVKMAVWNVALDDAYDAVDASDVSLRELARDLLLVAGRVGAAQPESNLGRCLKEILDELSNYRNFEAIYPSWAISFSRTLEGMFYEYEMRRRFSPLVFSDPLPQFDDYIYHAKNSVTIIYLYAAGLIVEETTEFLPFLPELLNLAGRCAVIIRLANDLRTFERELEEGGVNAVALKVHDLMRDSPHQNLPDLVALAKTEVRRLIQAEVAQAERASVQIKSGTAVEKGFIRATQFDVDLYAREDYREWATSLKRQAARAGG